MKEEKELLTRIGRQEPFTVPDGYFESLTERVMQRLPEKATPEAEPLTLWQRVKPWVYMTAMFAGLMCSMRLWMERPTPRGLSHPDRTRRRTVQRGGDGIHHRTLDAGRLFALSISERGGITPLDNP